MLLLLLLMRTSTPLLLPSSKVLHHHQIQNRKTFSAFLSTYPLFPPLRSPYTPTLKVNHTSNSSTPFIPSSPNVSSLKFSIIYHPTYLRHRRDRLELDDQGLLTPQPFPMSQLKVLPQLHFCINPSECLLKLTLFPRNGRV